MLTVSLLAGVIPVRADHAANLIGLVNLTNYQAALLDITDSPPDAPFASDTRQWVTAGQDFNDPNVRNTPLHIRIDQIDFTNGVVRVAENGVAQLYVPVHTNSSLAVTGGGLHLANADFGDVLDLYATLKNRTLLVHPGVNRSPVSLAANASSPADAARALEQALQQRGAVTVTDGDTFIWLIPTNLAASLLPAAEPDHPPALTATNTDDTLPKGSINFVNVPVSQAMAVYQTLTARKWVQDHPLPAGITLTFHNQSPLTKNETLHALTVLLNWHDLKIVNVGDQSFKLVPMTGK